MRREGSPFTGLAAVAMKEAADHLTSARMHLVMLLVLLTAFGAVYAAIGEIKDTVGQDPFLFLRLFTTAREPLPSFVSLLTLLLPLVAIALGFDAINGEYNRRTISRVLSQPIYRDALLTGKFIGGLIVLGICLVTLWLLLTGLGILTLGLPPSGEETLRGVAFLDRLARLCRRVAGDRGALLDALPRAGDLGACGADALALLRDLLGMLTPLIASALAPVNPFDPTTAVFQVEVGQALARISPNTLYGEATMALLNPATRSLGLVFMSQLQGALVGRAAALRRRARC